MITIQVAGAGAGKTYGLAQSILNLIKEKGTDVKIYALTYTNSAKRKIESEIIKQNRSHPENLRIETVHSFLLNEIVFPFSSYVITEKYHKASIIKLSDNNAYRAAKIKYLKGKNIIHADKVYEKAKLIIDKDCTKNKNKKQKNKVDKVISFINASIDYIFIDEAQDLDKNALKAFEILSMSDMDIHIIGDPKQAIKHPNSFSDFLVRIKNNSTIEKKTLPPNNISRRIPQNILPYTNQFCFPGQEQTSINETTGTIAYIESNDSYFDIKMSNWISDKNTIEYINKKEGVYSTSKEKKITLPDEIQEKIRLSNSKRDSEILAKVASREFAIDSTKNNDNSFPVKQLLKRYALDYPGPQLYAELCELAKQNHTVGEKYIVSSIDSVKGLEADTCVFILSPNMSNYLFQEIGDDKKFNKEWKKMYVALTRTENKLFFVIDHSLFKSQDIIESIKRKFIEKGIHKLE